MWSLRARDVSGLKGISSAVHDAYLVDGYNYDREAQVVIVPLLQEGWPDGAAPDSVLTRNTWRYREYLVTFFRGQLVVRQVEAVNADEDWADGPMLLGVDFDARTRQVSVVASDPLRLTVRALDVEVEVSSDPGGQVRRRIGRFTGIQSDKWLDAP